MRNRDFVALRSIQNPQSAIRNPQWDQSSTGSRRAMAAMISSATSW
jgi:hypothetical protein